jgi:ABC-type transporter Mla subunit MlaD
MARDLIQRDPADRVGGLRRQQAVAAASPAGKLSQGALEEERKRKLDLKGRGGAAKREEAAAARYGQTVAEAQIGRLGDAATLGRRGIRRSAAKRLAGALAGTPAGSGAQLAMARQGSADVADELGRFELGVEATQAQREREAVEARLGATAAESEALAFEASEIASATADTQDKLRSARATVDQLITDNSSFWGDNEEKVSMALLAEADAEDDPVVSDYLKRQAMDLLDDPGDVQSVTLSDGTTYTTEINPVDFGDY